MWSGWVRWSGKWVSFPFVLYDDYDDLWEVLFHENLSLKYSGAQKLEWFFNSSVFKPAGFISKARKRRQGNFFDESLLIYLEARYCFPLDNGFKPRRWSDCSWGSGYFNCVFVGFLISSMCWCLLRFVFLASCKESLFPNVCYILGWCECMLCVRLQQRAVLFYTSRGHSSDPQREAKTAPAQSRCGASAALFERANEAICNGILFSVRPQNCYQRPNKLAAAGLRPARQCTVLHPLSVFWAAWSH